MEQPIISKHSHALLDVPPIYGDVTEIARGSDKHGRRLRSSELSNCYFDSEFPSISRPIPKMLNFQAIQGLEKASSKSPTFSRPRMNPVYPTLKGKMCINFS